MTNSEDARTEATENTDQKAPVAATGDNEATTANLSTKAVNSLTEALSKVIRNVKAGQRDSVEVPAEGLRKQDGSDFAFGHYAAARWDK